MLTLNCLRFELEYGKLDLLDFGGDIITNKDNKVPSTALHFTYSDDVEQG